MRLLHTIKKMFPGLVSFRNRIYNYVAHYRFRNLPPEQVFKIIYDENHWRDKESKSGTGSSERSTVEVINIVNTVLDQFSVKSMLDVPCGDFNWMKNVNLSKIEYIGGDIVSELIEQNVKRHSGPKLHFQKLDLIESSLPKVDLIFTRDCLVHLSYADIHKAILNIKNSGSNYWLTTTFPKHLNYNIITGDWRPINLQQSPFNLPSPIIIYNENCQEDSRYIDKSLAIWKISDL